jgi:Bacterial PH domain
MNEPTTVRHAGPGTRAGDESAHEHELEPEYGLPEPLPRGERVLWQGSPQWRVMARRVFHVRKLTLYFGVILVLRAGTVLADGGTTAEALIAALWLLPAVLLALGMVTLMAWMSSRSTVYTITDRRVVMRVGIVLSLTFNLPFGRIAAAGLRRDPDGSGDIPLALVAAEKIAYVHLWPHARPWRLARPEPMLCSLPDAAQVARVLSQAWATATGTAVPQAAAAQPAAVPQGGASRPPRAGTAGSLLAAR